MEALAAAYATLDAKPEVATLRAAVPEILATWDDHDFCRNDAGASCKHANESQALFLNFWRGDDALARRGERRARPPTAALSSSSSHGSLPPAV